MSSALSGLREGVWELAKQKRERPAQELDQALKYAQLSEAGYNVKSQPSGRLFGGSQMVLERDPNMVSVKELERRKLMRDLDPAYVSHKDQSLIEYRQSKMFGNGEQNLTAGQRAAKDKATNDIFSTHEINKVQRGTIDKAMTGADTVPSGRFGRFRVSMAKQYPSTKKLFGVTDQNITDAQELKMALTQGTLAETAHTKGAISDSEMGLFREAAANDDFNSPAIQPVLQKMKAFLDADEAGKYGAYQKNYGEDPRAWFGGGTEQNQNANFGSVQEADASGLPPGSIVMVQGRKYQI